MASTLLSESPVCAGYCPNSAVSNEWTFKAMIRIGNLTVFPDRREIFVGGSPVELGCRAMDVLLVLIEANGALVTKEKLIDEVWPTTVVVDNNLHVHICGIRKMMGKDRKWLVSVPGRGYRLLRPVQLPHAASIFVECTDSRRGAQ